MSTKKQNRNRRGSRWGRHQEAPVMLAMHLTDLLAEWERAGNAIPSEKSALAWWEHTVGSIIGILAERSAGRGDKVMAQLLADTAKVLSDGRGVGRIVETRFAIWTALRKVYGEAPGMRPVSIADLEPAYHKLCPDFPLTDRTLAAEAKRAGYVVQNRGAPKSEVVALSASVFKRGNR